MSGLPCLSGIGLLIVPIALYVFLALLALTIFVYKYIQGKRRHIPVALSNNLGVQFITTVSITISGYYLLLSEKLIMYTRGLDWNPITSVMGRGINSQCAFQESVEAKILFGIVFFSLVIAYALLKILDGRSVMKRISSAFFYLMLLLPLVAFLYTIKNISF